MSALPAWRSLLYMPANVERFIAAAPRSGADAIQLDLEDSVTLAEKPAARAIVGDAAARLAQQGMTVIVRVNRPLAMTMLDMAAAISPAVTALALPKLHSAEHVQLLAEAADEIERERGMTPGTTRFIAMIETAHGVRRMAEIAAAHPRVVGVTIGTEDLSADLGVLPDAPLFETLSAQLVVNARAAGVLPLGLVGSIAQLADLDGFRAMVRRSRAFGFMGSSCVHPSQVPILNEEFSPADADVERARRIVAAYDEALARGAGAIALNGQMIDVPVADRARALLERHAAITANAEHPG